MSDRFSQGYWIDRLIRDAVQQGILAGNNIDIVVNEDGSITISGQGGSQTLVIQDHGIPLPTRGSLDFAGAGVTITDDPINNRTVITIPGGGSGTLDPAMTFHRIAANGTNAVNVKAAPGTLFGWNVYNASDKLHPDTGGYPIFLKIYDAAGVPNVGVDIPIRTVGVQAGQASSPLSYDGGLIFVNGIAIAVVKGIADTDTTGVEANSCVVDLNLL